MFKTNAKRRHLFLVAAATLSLGFVSLASHPTQTQAASSKTFSASQTAGLTGYYSSTKAGYAFHWKYLQSSKGIQRVLIFGDFKKPTVMVAVPTKLASQSKDKRTLKFTVKTANSKGKLSKTNYSFYIKKQSATQFTVKLKSYSTGKLPSTSGTAYRFTRTSSSPATKLTNEWTRDALTKTYTKQVNANVEKQYQEALAAGKKVADPKTDATTQAKIKSTVDSAADKGVKQVIKNFNYNV
ncbi:hypothetical protein FC96_GL002384 [Secundilactobacillus kimchicus JCM 15530]|uniref:Uncharacterized protein n=1 Tax=Secundilactobacillus kimchicus JCM 15530 TaxID=1302272 RepID=A0A0R1HMC5_9LACO|nr:hypothetical protein [Secundilactobacillus kimchicus]KRK47660.1 hypothetical protein FC96_GL002384 [Secundilactobacillus kimchicus JCM 15530]